MSGEAIVFRRPRVGARLFGRYRIEHVERSRRGHYRVTVSTGRIFFVRVELGPEAPAVPVGRGLAARGDGPPVEPLAELEDPYRARP